MAIDHFIKHKWSRERTDWNFNILFNDQPQVANLAAQYEPIIKRHPGLYQPVPSKWLHATVLRVGFVEDFTEAEMLAVADKLESKLARVQMPQFFLGKRYWLWNGGPALSITPKKPLQEVYSCALDSLIEIVGRDRLPYPSIPFVIKPRKLHRYLNSLLSIIGLHRLPVSLQFIPHVTLAYPRTYKDEHKLARDLESHPIKGVTIRAKRLSLIKQRVENNYYVWEIVKEIPIGQLK